MTEYKEHRRIRIQFGTCVSDTKVVDAETGENIGRVKKVVVTHECGSLPTAEITLLRGFHVDQTHEMVIKYETPGEPVWPGCEKCELEVGADARPS